MKSILLLFCLFIANISLGMEGWLTDVDEAMRLAEDKDMAILIALRGEDWSPHDVGHPERMLTSPEFHLAAKGNFVLLVRPFAAKIKNPFIIFTDSKLRPYHIVGKLPDRIKSIHHEMEYAQAIKQGFINLVDRLENAQGEEMFKLAGDLRDYISEDLYNFLPQYELVAEEIKAVDENDVGRFRQYDDLKNERVSELADFLTELGLKSLAQDEPLTPEEQSTLATILERDNLKLPTYSLRTQQRGFTRMLNFEIRNNLKKIPTIDQLLSTYDPVIQKIRDIDPESKWSRISSFELRELYILHHTVEVVSRAKVKDLQKMADLMDVYMTKYGEKELTLKQLFVTFKGGINLNLGKLDEGLALLEEAKRIAPWTHNAGACRDLTIKVRDNKERIRRYQQELREGNTANARELNNLLSASLNLRVGL